MQSIRVFMSLAAVGILACACAGSGGGSGSSASATSSSISGTYIDSFKNLTTGDCYVSSYSFNNGQIESGLYYFKNCGQSAAFLKYTGTYSLNGNVYSPVYTYQTCPVPNGITEAYTITSAGTNMISIDINYSAPINGLSNVQIVGTQESSLNSFLGTYGMIAAVEDTNCNLIPGD